MSRNYGLDLDRERAEQKGDEWRFGALSQPGIANIPLNLRDMYLPKGELQYGKEDFRDCASRSPHNALEAQFNYLYLNGLLSASNKKWLRDSEYVNADDRIEFSDRFTAILSGTTRAGNSLKSPLESIRKNGLIPKKMLPASPDIDFDAYHDTSKITKEMRDLGQEFRNRFTINYEQVHRSHFSEALKDDVIGVAGFAWPPKKNGVYPKADDQPNHAFLLYRKPDFEAFDNYTEAESDFTKTLALDYTFWEYGYRVFISKETDYAAQLSLWQQLLDALKRLFEVKKDMLQTSPIPPKPMPPANNLLNTMALAVQKHEGWIVNPPSRSVRNNNPGNVRYSSVGYASKYGVVKEDRTGVNVKAGQRGFAIFKDYETGFLYLKNLILDKAKKHPDWTLFDFFGNEKEGWAPNSDNNDSGNYACTVAKAMNVKVDEFRLKTLLS